MEEILSGSVLLVVAFAFAFIFVVVVKAKFVAFFCSSFPSSCRRSKHGLHQTDFDREAERHDLNALQSVLAHRTAGSDR